MPHSIHVQQYMEDIMLVDKKLIVGGTAVYFGFLLMATAAVILVGGVL